MLKRITMHVLNLHNGKCLWEKFLQAELQLLGQSIRAFYIAYLQHTVYHKYHLYINCTRTPMKLNTNHQGGD